MGVHRLMTKAIILAAGRGSRMGAMTDATHKSLCKIRGKRLIDWQIEALRGAGIQDIAIVTGYRREDLVNLGLKEFHNPRWNETNMLSSLSVAKAWLSAGPCVVSYSDIFYKSEAVKLLLGSTDPISITFDPNWLEQWRGRFSNPLDDAESFKIRGDGTLLEIGKKPKNVDEIQGQYMGLFKLTPRGWQAISSIMNQLDDKSFAKMHMTSAFELIIQRSNLKIKAIAYVDFWGEVDSQSDLKYFNSDDTKLF